MKRRALALTLILALSISLVAGVLVVNVAKANPFFIFESVPPIPGTIPPVITVSSPENNTAYASNNVHISFNISKPQPPIAYDTGIISVSYTLDNNHTGLYYCSHYNSNFPPGIPTFTFSENFTLPAGNHTLAVHVGGVVLPGNMTIYFVGSSVAVFFITGANSQQSLESIPEFPSWIILPLIMVTTFAVIVVKRRLP